MNLSEAKLKQLVLEEAQRCVIERQVEEFVQTLQEELAKEGIVLNEEQLEEASKWAKRLGTAALGGALALGAGSAYEAEQEYQQDKEELHQAAAERMADYEFWDVEALTKAVYGSPSRWGWRATSRPSETLLPTMPDEWREAYGISDDQPAVIMPPSWTVMKKVMETKKLKKDVPGSEAFEGESEEEGIPLYAPELSPQFNKPWNEMSDEEKESSRSQAVANINNFFKHYGDKLEYTQATTSIPTRTGKEVWMYEIPWSKLNPNYVLPDAGITVEQYYNELMYGHQREGGEFYAGHDDLQNQLSK